MEEGHFLTKFLTVSGIAVLGNPLGLGSVQIGFGLGCTLLTLLTEKIDI